MSFRISMKIFLTFCVNKLFVSKIALRLAQRVVLIVLLLGIRAMANPSWRRTGILISAR